MTVEDKIEKAINSQDYIAYVLHYEYPKNYERGGNEELDKATEIQFNELKDDFIIYRQYIESKLGPPTYLVWEPEWDEWDDYPAPIWAPMGYYIEWEIKDDIILCLFFGGDTNPESPFEIIVAKTNKNRKSKDYPCKYEYDDTDFETE